MSPRFASDRRRIATSAPRRPALETRIGNGSSERILSRGRPVRLRTTMTIIACPVARARCLVPRTPMSAARDPRAFHRASMLGSDPITASYRVCDPTWTRAGRTETVGALGHGGGSGCVRTAAASKMVDARCTRTSGGRALIPGRWSRFRDPFPAPAGGTHVGVGAALARQPRARRPIIASDLGYAAAFHLADRGVVVRRRSRTPVSVGALDCKREHASSCPTTRAASSPRRAVGATVSISAPDDRDGRDKRARRPWLTDAALSTVRRRRHRRARRGHLLAVAADQQSHALGPAGLVQAGGTAVVVADLHRGCSGVQEPAPGAEHRVEACWCARNGPVAAHTADGGSAREDDVRREPLAARHGRDAPGARGICRALPGVHRAAPRVDAVEQHSPCACEPV